MVPLTDCRLSGPLPALVLLPEVTDTFPPTFPLALVVPAENTNAPPTPDVPDPAATEIDPPRPLLAELPLLRYSHPLLPIGDAPVANTMSPLLPAVALAPAVFSVSLPLDDAVLEPDVTDTSPPLAPEALVKPAASVRLPP